MCKQLNGSNLKSLNQNGLGQNWKKNWLGQARTKTFISLSVQAKSRLKFVFLLPGLKNQACADL